MNTEHVSELQSWNADVLSTGICMPFTVPESYFDQLSSEVVSIIRASGFPDPTVQHLPKTTPYSISDTYFEHLADNILAKTQAADKIILHKETPWQDQKELPYHVPPAYFEQLPGIIMERIAADQLTVEGELQQKTSFLQDLKANFPLEAPQGYFESLPEQVWEKVHSQTALDDPELSPSLAGLKNSMPFSVPEGYFNHPQHHNPDFVPQAAFKKKRTNWAIAAGLALLLTLSGWWFFNQQDGVAVQAPVATSSTLDLNGQLAMISKEEIQLYIENHIDEFDENSLANVISQEGTSYDWEDALQGVSLQDIESYLEGNL